MADESVDNSESNHPWKDSSERDGEEDSRQAAGADVSNEHRGDADVDGSEKEGGHDRQQPREDGRSDGSAQREAGDTPGDWEPRGDGPRQSTSQRSVRSDVRALESILDRTGRDLSRPVIAEGALWWAVTMVAVVVSALLVAGLVPEHGYAAARWVLLIGLGSTTLGAVAALGAYLWRRPGPVAVATRVQRHSAEFRSDLVAALEFGRTLRDDGNEALRDQGMSPAMARAHVSRTLRKAHRASERNSLAHLVPSRNLAPPVLALSGGVAMLMIPLLLSPGWVLGVLSGERIGSPVVGERVSEEAIVGNVMGVFDYPSYTGREREERPLGTGYVEGLQGTEVQLYATLMPGEWTGVEMVVETGEDGEEQTQIVDMNLLDGRRASATLTLEDGGHYWFKAETPEGRPIEDRQKRRIEVVEDSDPEIRIVSHEGRVSVQPDDVVEFEIEATDDFGIDSVRRAHHFQGAEDDAEYKKLEGPELASQSGSVEMTSSLDLDPLELKPKDAVVVYFEARDVNTVTGPGETTSEPVVLYVESKEDKHMDNINAQQDIMESLLMHLGDVLEAPVGQRELIDDEGTYRQQVQGDLDSGQRLDRFHRTQRLHSDRTSLLEGMDRVVDRLEDDPLMVARNRTLFEGIYSRVQRLQDEGEELFSSLETRAERRDLTAADIQKVADYAADTERILEDGVMTLEDLLMSQKIDLVEKTADDIDELRDQLRDLLEQYRDTDDPELRQAIEREIQRLRQRMDELAARMQMQLREMPREHVNLEAMEGMEMEAQAGDVGAELDRVEEMFEDGDIDGALDALDEMEANLDAMTSEMDDSFGDMQPAGLSELDEAVSEMMDEIGHLRDLEAEIIDDTQELSDELRRERQEQLDELMEPVIEELLEAIDTQHRQLEQMEQRQLAEQDISEVERTQEAVERLEEMVEQRDMEQALERARSAQNRIRSLRRAMLDSRRFVDEHSPRGRDLERSIDDVDEIFDRGGRIKDQIEDFIDRAQEELSSGQEERFEELAERQRQVRERTRELHEELAEQAESHPELEDTFSPGEADGDERPDEMPGSPVEEAQRAMEQAEEQLGERRVQRALDEERRAIEHLDEMSDGMGQALQQRREQERDAAEQRGVGDDDDVDIPGEDSGEARERIREEMMEGMREQRDESYEDEIERYFRSLVE